MAERVVAELEGDADPEIEVIKRIAREGGGRAWTTDYATFNKRWISFDRATIPIVSDSV